MSNVVPVVYDFSQ